MSKVEPARTVPSLVELTWVNWPPCGSLSTMVSGYGVSEPVAQSGTQPWMLDVPVPSASWGPQLDQTMPVTM